MPDLSSLNPEQRDAVETTDGPLLVLAGAGTGKTRVITYRIAYLLSRGVPPTAILGVTFTNKAAAEMRTRLRRMVGADRARQLTLSTFHSLGLEILKAERARQSRSGRFTIFDAADQLACLREVTRQLRLERSYELGSILARISRFKNAFVAPDAATAGRDDYDQAAALFYPRYNELMSAYAAVDFDDLVCEPAKLLASDDDCRSRWQDRFRYILVDEYQDTNGAQMKLLRGLVGADRNICVVGDDDQAIYGWRGADVRHILRFERDFSGAKVVRLERNYRSRPGILQLANHVISQSHDRYGKELRATRQTGAPVRLIVAEDGDREATFIASEIGKALDSERYRPRDVAILYRSNTLARPLEMALRERGIAYRVVGGTVFFDRREAKDLIAYLRLLRNPRDELSLRRVINSPPRGIGPKTLLKLSDWAAARKVGLHASLAHADEILESPRIASAVHRFVALLDDLRATAQSSHQVGPLLDRLIDHLQLRDEFDRTSPSADAALRRWRIVEGVLQTAHSYDAQVERPSVADFLSRYALDGPPDRKSDRSTEEVTLSTLHAAKGLEFGLVFMPGLEEGVLPHDRTLTPHENDISSGDLGEERRLCYVGITRAKDELVLSRAKERLLRNRPTPRNPSRFFEAIPEELIASNDLTEAPPVEDVKAMLSNLRAQWG